MKRSMQRPRPETAGEVGSRLNVEAAKLDQVAGDLGILQSQVNDLIFEVKDVQNVRHQLQDTLRECLKAMTVIFLQELRAERAESIRRLRVVEDQD